MHTTLKRLLPAALFVVIAAGSSEVDAGAAQKKNKGAVIGTLVAVDDQGNSKATLTVKIQPTTKKNDPNQPAAEEKMFKVDEKTTFEVTTKKGQSVPGLLTDLKAGDRLEITLKGEKVASVVIHHAKKKKKT